LPYEKNTILSGEHALLALPQHLISNRINVFPCYPITTSKKVKNGASVHEDVRKHFYIKSDKEKKKYDVKRNVIPMTLLSW